jgi:hypothetical protein
MALTILITLTTIMSSSSVKPDLPSGRGDLLLWCVPHGTSHRKLGGLTRAVGSLVSQGWSWSISGPPQSRPGSNEGSFRESTDPFKDERIGPQQQASA